MSPAPANRNFFQRLLPPTHLLVTMGLMVLAHMQLPIMGVLPRPWNYIGIGPMILGFLLVMYCMRLYSGAGTTIKPFEESTKLFTSGPYAWTRNPIYLGMLLFAFGFAVLLGTLTPLMVPPVFAVLLREQFILPEEEMLASKFGQEYADYRERVRRWL